MCDSISSITSATVKSLRSIVGEAVLLQQEPPGKSELIWGIFVRGSGVPVAIAGLICLIADWEYAVEIEQDWSNTFLTIALLISITLNIFLFTNIVLKLKNSPRASKFRRYLAYIDAVVISLLVIGVTERLQQNSSNEPWYNDVLPSKVQICVFAISLSLAFMHFVGGAVMTVVAIKNWIQIQRLSPEEYRDFKLGIRPLYPPPAYCA
ncbi:uncharacterized protein PV09_02685 [Verruconis gallopava]|uniref:Uncharacterized protein n=1 Tax=Verruconis gallopava TaxID=253628 RepID=A0A0D2AH13_9PEZI|nr:uncharacterized protein PV09_02685 [Verruconis gallopava]KIW06208.1 hypothetical protein PV09_02685 [Verruconis gallopava]